MVVMRSATRQSVDEALLRDQQRVQMELQSGDSRQVVLMASPDEVRAALSARPQPQSPPEPNDSTTMSVATETQRRLLAHAHRTRHLLSRREATETLSRSRRREMVREIQSLKETMQTLQGEVEVTARSVESMQRLALQLERLTREFMPRGVSEQASSYRDPTEADGVA
ncbi:hypothetical protein PHYBOEH_011481 [Phytophthora boehmeriae]|uniref:Uncharacterized protein n=1 Tax=Phytophthora boehmeriae TaxID=109152 RepID=A0A8T1VJI9_9STRA|nr:hypothetical protein PHYBOEH_011481 [Phytophthora boehmeriae]